MDCHFCDAKIEHGKSNCRKCGARFGYLVRGEVRGQSWIVLRMLAWAVVMVAGLLLLSSLTGMTARAVALLPLILGLWMLGRLTLLLAKKPKWWRRTI